MKTKSMILKDHTLTYGVECSGIPGLISTVIGGNIPDDTMGHLALTNIRELSKMSVEELEQLPGMTKNKATKLVAAFELSRRLTLVSPENRPKIKNPEDVASLLMGEMRHYEQEYIKVICLNAKNRVICITTVTIGTADKSLLHPREVYKIAIKKNSASIILVHNHPSGDPTPSSEDESITKSMVEAGKILGIEVLDHIIIGDKKYVSLKERGDM